MVTLICVTNCICVTNFWRVQKCYSFLRGGMGLAWTCGKDHKHSGVQVATLRGRDLSLFHDKLFLRHRQSVHFKRTTAHILSIKHISEFLKCTEMYSVKIHFLKIIHLLAFSVELNTHCAGQCCYSFCIICTPTIHWFMLHCPTSLN